MAGKLHARLSDDQLVDWLRLIRSENVGPRTFRALIGSCGSARAALEALPELARRGGAPRAIRAASAEEVERELALARKLGVRFVAIAEPDYPPILRRIELGAAAPRLPRPARGAATAGGGDRRIAQRLGGRAHLRRTTRARPRAGRLCRGLGPRPRDRSARARREPRDRRGRGARRGHAKPYPSEAIPLIERIIEVGAIVSEMPIEQEPRGRDFPRRNRIVSGLALGTIVVEAARGSGSLITARFALEQNRCVFAVPGSPLDPRAEGTNDLLKQGATICTSVDDVLTALEPMRPDDVFAVLEEGGGDGEPLWGDHALLGVDPQAAPRAKQDAGFAGDEPDQAGGPTFVAADRIGAARDRVVALLGPSPITLDELARAADASPREVRVALMELELAGRVEFSGGDRVALRPAADAS